LHIWQGTLRMQKGFRLQTCSGLLLAAGALIVVAMTAAYSPVEIAAAQRNMQEAVLARIDSLWEADAGLVARDQIRQHIPAARTVADSLFLLNLLFREGRLLAALNRPLEGESILREGLALAEALNESLLYRACLRWLGVALIGRGRMKDVQESFEQLLRLSQESGDRYHEGYGWMGLAYNDWRNGMPDKAREKYARSADIFRELGQLRGELWALTGLNNALTMLGEYDEAIAGNRRIAAMGKESNSREIEALGHNNLGVLLYSLGDPGEAHLHFHRAAELQEQRGNVRDAIIAGRNVCLCEIALGRTNDASRRLRELMEKSRTGGYNDIQASLLSELAYAHLQQGENLTASSMFREALAMKEGLTPKAECESIIGLSRALARLDSTRVSLELLRSHATRILDFEDARIQFAFRNEMAERLLDEGLPYKALETAMIVENRGKALGLTAYRLEALPLAAQAAERLGKIDSAIVLLRRGVQLWETDRGLPLDPEWRELRSAAARELFAQLTRLLVSYPPGRPRELRIRDAFDVMQQYKARTLLERILGPGGQQVPVLQVAPVRLGELQGGILRPGELLLDCIVGADSTQLFACTLQECRTLVLPGEAELARKSLLFHDLLAARPHAPLSPADRESIAAISRSLSTLLFSSCADMIAGARHLIIAPDGVLNLLPFSILFSSLETVRAPNGKGGFVASRIPAATVLAWQRSERSGDRDVPAGSILALASRTTDKGEILTGAKDEISNLTRRYTEVSIELYPVPSEREQLSAAAFSGFEIIHLAAHSTADDQSPWRSAIYLDIDGERFPLRASEIASWKLPASLVVLSSCESAGGRILSGEGVQGLTSAFLSAGVPSVLASLWPVDDQVSVEFMTVLYEALHEGASVSTSVHRAQQALRERPATEHPFYWAGFVLTGEGELCVHIDTRRSLQQIWMLAFLVLLVAGLAIQAGRKKYHRTR